MTEKASTIISNNAYKIQQFLIQKGLTSKIVEFEESTRTAQDAAQAIGCDVAQIVKSLIFRTIEHAQPILVLVSGKNRLNEHMIEQAVGEKIAKADADFTREVTGFAIGGIPPICHKQPLKTFIDKDLMDLNPLWAAAGTPHAVFCLQNEDLIFLTNGSIIKVC